MRLTMLGFVLLIINADNYADSHTHNSVVDKKIQCGIDLMSSDEQSKKSSSQRTAYEIFARKYEATFGEKPSTQVWNCRNDSCCCGNF